MTTVNYPNPVTVNGYSGKNCTDVDNAKKNIDPSHPKDGPYGVDAEDPASEARRIACGDLRRGFLANVCAAARPRHAQQPPRRRASASTSSPDATAACCGAGNHPRLPRTEAKWESAGMRSRLSDKIGPALRKLRLARGWSLVTLSEQSGVPVSTLSRVELGQNALNSDKLVRLCRALEVDLEG